MLWVHDGSLPHFAVPKRKMWSFLSIYIVYLLYWLSLSLSKKTINDLGFCCVTPVNRLCFTHRRQTSSIRSFRKDWAKGTVPMRCESSMVVADMLEIAGLDGLGACQDVPPEFGSLSIHPSSDRKAVQLLRRAQKERQYSLVTWSSSPSWRVF